MTTDIVTWLWFAATAVALAFHVGSAMCRVNHVELDRERDAELREGIAEVNAMFPDHPPMRLEP